MKEGFQKAAKANKIIIEKRFGDAEMAQVKKHKSFTEIALHKTKHSDLDFLKVLESLRSVELYDTQVDDYTALSHMPTLENLFLNSIKNHEDLSFIHHITQVKKLSLLYLSKLETFPDLSACVNLNTVVLWQCKKLEHINNLDKIPNLEEVKVVDTPQKPGDLEFLLKKTSVKYVSAQFGNTKDNEAFEALLKQYNKTKNRP